MKRALVGLLVSGVVVILSILTVLGWDVFTGHFPESVASVWIFRCMFVGICGVVAYGVALAIIALREPL